jgi:hypothetical protein
MYQSFVVKKKLWLKILGGDWDLFAALKILPGPCNNIQRGEVNRLHQYLRAHSLNANAAYNRRACLSLYRSMLSAHVWLTLLLCKHMWLN